MKVLIADLNGAQVNGETKIGDCLEKYLHNINIDCDRIYFTKSGKKRVCDVLGSKDKFAKLDDAEKIFSKYDIVHINSQNYGKYYPKIKHPAITTQVHATSNIGAYDLKKFYANINVKKTFLYQEFFDNNDKANWWTEIIKIKPFIDLSDTPNWFDFEYSYNSCIKTILFGSRMVYHKQPMTCVVNAKKHNFNVDVYNCNTNGLLAYQLKQKAGIGAEFFQESFDASDPNRLFRDKKFYFARFCATKYGVKGRLELTILECMRDGIVPIVSENFFSDSFKRDINGISIDEMIKLNNKYNLLHLIGNNKVLVKEFDMEKICPIFVDVWKKLI